MAAFDFPRTLRGARPHTLSRISDGDTPVIDLFGFAGADPSFPLWIFVFLVALGTLPLVFVTEIGFAVAFGVLLDTFVVRSVLVTALNLDVGRRIWWPSSLARKQDVSLDELAEDTSAALTR